MIHYRSVSKSFGRNIVLKELDLFIKKGDIMVILGGSGTGKSVLTSMLVGLLFPDSGMISIDGHELPNTKEDKRWKEIWKKVGYLFQGGALFDSYTIYENISFPLKYGFDLSKAEIEEKVMKLLSMLNIEDTRDKYPSELSGGMQKRAALARSVAIDPDIIVYDEPTTGLDPVTSDRVGELINQMKNEYNATSVVVSHDIRLTKRIADKLAFLHDKKIAWQGDPADIHSAPAVLREFFEL